MKYFFDDGIDPFRVEHSDTRAQGLTEEEREVLRTEGLKRLDTGSEATGGWTVDRFDPEFERKRLEGLDRFQKKQQKEREARQQKVIDLVKLGWTIRASLDMTEVPQKTYERWRKYYPEFKAKMEAAQKEGSVIANGLKSVPPGELPFAVVRKTCFGRETFPYQQVIVDIIENAPEGEMSMILLPPGVGKTMTLEDWLTIELAKNQTLRCIYISESDDLGERTMEVIKQRFENQDGTFDKLAELYGKLYDPDTKRAWRQKEIRMPGADFGLRDYNLRTRGMRSQIYSMRADIIILDDIQTRNSLGLTSKFLADIRGTILTRREGAVNGKVIYIGTRLQLGDLAGELIDQGVVLPENLYVMPLINTEGLSNFEEVIKTSSLPTLVRQMGSEFQAVYQQNPAAVTGKTFGEVVEKVKDSTYTIREWNHAHPPEDEILGRVVSIDPALTGGNAVIAFGYTATDLYVYDLDIAYETGRMSYAENIIEEFVLAYMADTVIVEDKAYQKALLTSERMETMAAQYGFKLEAHTTGSDKFDPVFGVAKMETPMMFGRIHVPWGDEYSRARMKPLVDQLRTWRPDVPTKTLVQDAVMALWFGHVYVLRKRRTKASQQKAREMARMSEARRPRPLRFKTTMPMSGRRRHR